jgi:hypothetical protein
MIRLTTIAVLVVTLAGMATAWAQMPAGSPGPYSEIVNQGRKAATVTPSDTVDFALGPTRFLYSGATAACVLNVLLADDSTAVLITAVPAGTFLPLRARRVFATSTTCTVMVGIW